MSLKNITVKILKKINPSSEEEKKIKTFVSEFVRISKTISGKEIVVCGSIGKFTWLKGDHDIDLFVVFPKETERDELEEKGLEYGKRVIRELRGREQIKYAEHPYVRGFVKGFVIDIVPCYGISEGENIISAVDRSPLHLKYILNNLPEKSRDEARLLKQFCKGISVYGSDTKTEGFSGYICELLIIKYGNFESVLKNAANWAAGHKIDIENNSEISFRDQPLVIIDPIDKNRNAAANVNAENFLKFVRKCDEFLKRPSEKFFFSKKEKLSGKEITTLKERETLFVAYKMQKPDIIDDILYPQLRRSLRRIETMLNHEDFSAIRSYEFSDEKKAYMILELDIFSLPEIKKMIGPPIFVSKHVEEFKTKYKRTSVEGTRLVAEKNRDFPLAIDFLKNLQKLSSELLKEKGMPENLVKEFKKSKLLEGKEFFAELRKNQKLSEYIREKYFGE